MQSGLRTTIGIWALGLIPLAGQSCPPPAGTKTALQVSIGCFKSLKRS